MSKKIVYTKYKVKDGVIQLEVKDNCTEMYDKDWKELIWKNIDEIKINAHDIYWIGMLDEHISCYLEQKKNLKKYYSNEGYDNIDYYEIRKDLNSNVWLEKFKLVREVRNDYFWLENGIMLEKNVQSYITQNIDQTAKFNITWEKDDIFHGEYDGEGAEFVYEIKTFFVDNIKLYFDEENNVHTKKDENGNYILREENVKVDKKRIEKYGRKKSDGTRTFEGFHIPFDKIEYMYQVYMYKYASNKNFMFFMLLYSLRDYNNGLENFKIKYVDNRKNINKMTFTNNGINLISNPYLPCCARERLAISDFYERFCNYSIPRAREFYKKYITVACSPKMSKKNLINIEEAFYQGREEE